MGAGQKSNLRAAIEVVAAKLGNTPTICRKCYIHPEIMNAYLDGNLIGELQSAVEKVLRENLVNLQPEEAAVMAMLRTRLKGIGQKEARVENPRFSAEGHAAC